MQNANPDCGLICIYQNEREPMVLTMMAVLTQTVPIKGMGSAKTFC